MSDDDIVNLNMINTGACCACNGSCNHTGLHSYCSTHSIQALSPLLPEGFDRPQVISLLSNEALLLQQLLEEIRKISDKLDKLEDIAAHTSYLAPWDR